MDRPASTHPWCMRQHPCHGPSREMRTRRSIQQTNGRSRMRRNPGLDEPAPAIRSQWQALQKRPQASPLLSVWNGHDTLDRGTGGYRKQVRSSSRGGVTGSGVMQPRDPRR
jgi:hypothetical protein